MTQKQKGILYMILSALSFAIMQVVVRLTKEIPTMEQIFVRNLFVLIAAFVIIRRNKGSLFGERKYQAGLFGRSLFGFLSLITLFYASSHAAQGDVTIINKLSPVCVTLLAVFWLKEKMSPVQIPALILSILGACIVFQPSFQSNPLPLIMAFLSAVSSGIAYTFLGYFKDKVDGMTVIMHFSTFSAVCSLPFMLGSFVMPDLRQLLLLLLIGVFGSLGQAFITYAYRFAPASEISIYNYTGILFSLLLGFVILGEPVKMSSIAGGALVAAASILVYVYNNRGRREKVNGI
ncbi:DMT family transporter [Lacrimispora sp. 210928-DFI.3.58]|uniref:DMT family transporter n=1 Tax=Lacrimispora sp. 210928-DFI.3.58 TaxID=2883214 RepID=UPI001D070DE3|nr:DMT family transporter [Lacrimispora sp. 210928-DFI.3.58]MCB7319732.1 DMT family transporter [Lacrimispora sp. 210928-DFI.3.58]